MSQEFKNRVFGCVILKSINSNFNADFTHHPRTLPDGVVYSTDKAIKYSIKDYFRKYYKDEKLFYVKRFDNESLNPFTLARTYKELFGEMPKAKGNDKNEIIRSEVLNNLLTCLDIKLFGATFAGETNISIHGPVQINHGINRFCENEIYTEDILSPFATDDTAQMSTIGNQTNLKEGHYVFSFSINPKNTNEFYELINKKNNENGGKSLSIEDINKLKEAFNNSVTALDSSRKIGTENEATLWIQLKEGSRKMLPGLSELVSINESKEIDFSRIDEILNGLVLKDDNNENTGEYDIESVELYYNPSITKIIGISKKCAIKHFNILNNKEI